MMLPDAFLSRPIAHRALHDHSDGRPENSREAIAAAIAAGYGIEIDLQLSSDGVAMVFHDYHLARLTAATGAVAQRTAAELGATVLTGGETGVPTFAEVLDLVAGQVPLLVEIKDQDGALGDNVGALERAAAADLVGYNGAVAVMSFNPHSVAAFAEASPEIPRGLVTDSYSPKAWPTLSAAACDRLREIPDFDRVAASFISHQVGDLARSRVAELKAAGVPVMCWTVRSPEMEAEARQVADQITFEGYLA